jgi:hypothetical protein
MRADECRSLPWVDRGGAHLDPGGLFLQPKGDAAIPIAPAAAVHGLDHDLLREIGDRGMAFARPAAGSLQVVHCRYPPRTASTHCSSGFTCRHQLGIAFGCTRVMASILLGRHVAHLRRAGKGLRAGQGERSVGPDGRVAVHYLPRGRPRGDVHGPWGAAEPTCGGRGHRPPHTHDLTATEASHETGRWLHLHPPN